jgi:hypothetical protein
MSGDDVGRDLVFELADAVAQGEFAALEALQLQLVARQAAERVDGGVEIAMLDAQALHFVAGGGALGLAAGFVFGLAGVVAVAGRRRAVPDMRRNLGEGVDDFGGMAAMREIGVDDVRVGEMHVDAMTIALASAGRATTRLRSATIRALDHDAIRC